MLNKKSKLFLALLLGASVSITACNNEGESKPASSTEADKKTEAPADTTMKKSDTTQRPIIPGN